MRESLRNLIVCSTYSSAVTFEVYFSDLNSLSFHFSMDCLVNLFNVLK